MCTARLRRHRAVPACLRVSLLLALLPASLCAAPTNSWGPDGGSGDRPLVVSSLRVDTSQGPRLWLGGNFDVVGRVTGRAAWFDSGSAALDARFGIIDVDRVLASVALPDGGWLLAGQSTERDAFGNPQGFVRRMRDDGSLDTAFVVTLDSPAQSLALVGTRIAVGGGFSQVNGVPRRSVALLDTNGQLTSWDAALDFGGASSSNVTTLLADGQRIYIGGNFVSAAGQAAPGLVALDADSGALLWRGIDDLLGTGGIALRDGAVYAGVYRRAGTSFTSHIDVFDAGSGALLRSFATQGLALTLALADGTPLYAGGVRLTSSSTSALTAFDPQSGAVISSFNPAADNAVFSIRLSGGVLYAGGAFHRIGGQPRSFLAAVNPNTGAATGWQPEPGRPVQTVVAAGSRVLAGGDFSVANAVQRHQFAELDPVSGEPTSFTLDLNGTPLDMSSDGSTAYLVGGFSAVNGVRRNHAAGISLSTRSLTSFNPPNADTLDYATVAVDNRYVYIGGRYNYLINDNGRVLGHRNLAGFDKSTGSVRNRYTPDPDLEVQSLLIGANNTLYASGLFQTIGGVTRRGAAALSSSGSVLSFNPDVQPLTGTRSVRLAYHPLRNSLLLFGLFDTVKGQPRNNLAEVNLSSGAPTTWAPTTNDTVWDLSVHPVTGNAYAGGVFTTANGQQRRGIAVFDGNATLLPLSLDTQLEVRTVQLAPQPTGTYSLDLAGQFQSAAGRFSQSFAAVTVSE